MLVEDQFSDLKESYAWENIKEGGLVDIGGGRGHVSIALARVSCQMSCMEHNHTLADFNPVVSRFTCHCTGLCLDDLSR
jgi:hypothetical protein